MLCGLEDIVWIIRKLYWHSDQVQMGWVGAMGQDVNGSFLGNLGQTDKYSDSITSLNNLVMGKGGGRPIYRKYI